MASSFIPFPDTVAVVYYDDDCGFCRAWTDRAKKRISRQDLSFAPSTDPGFARLGLDPETDSVVFVHRDHILLKSDAVLAVVSRLDRPWRWLTVFRFLPHVFCDACYDVVAHNRYRLGGKCQIPPSSQVPPKRSL